MVELLNKGFDFKNNENYAILKYNNFENKYLVDEIDDPKATGLIILHSDLTLNQIKNINNNISDFDVVHDLTDIPKHIKYLRIDSSPTKYIFPDTLEYIEMEITLSKPEDNISRIENSFLKTIKWPTALKALNILFQKYNIFDTLSNEEINEKCLKIPIPRNLEYLRVNYYIPNIHEFTNLKTYIIDSHDNEDWDYSVDSLPPTLEWLDIMPYHFNQPLDNLPANLKILKFGQNRIWNIVEGYTHRIDNLPIRLEVLYFPECITLDGTPNCIDIDNLPPNLKILYIPRYIPKNMDFNCLPDSIEIINWYNFIEHCEQITKYPANLKKINVFNGDYQKLQSLKKSLNIPYNIEINSNPNYNNYMQFLLN